MRRRKDTGLDALDYIVCGIIVTLLGGVLWLWLNCWVT